jgi:hypothetical protein
VACRVQVYYPFYKDFGPLNLGLAFRFCRKTAQLLQARAHILSYTDLAQPGSGGSACRSSPWLYFLHSSMNQSTL